MRISKDKLDLAMAKKCYSTERLSEITGIHAVSIARIKNGSQMARPATIGRIAKALDVPVEDLIESDRR